MKENNLLEGKYRKNPKGFGFVKIENQDEEVYIAKENSRYALNGDTVIIKLIDKPTGKSTEGKIVKIIKHENDTVVGIFQKSKNFGFVVPDDKTLGTDIFIRHNRYGCGGDGPS